MDIIKKRFKPQKEVRRFRKKLELLAMKGTITEIEEHGNETNLRFMIRGPLYDGRKESMTRITINLSSRERPVDFSTRHLETIYYEIPSFDVNVMGSHEISAEKIRCIMEREKPRDIYDLYFLFNRGKIPNMELIDRKLSSVGISFDKSNVMKRIERMKGIWKKDLDGLIMGELPKFNKVKEVIEQNLNEIINETEK